MEINYQFIASSPSGNNEEIQVSAELSVYPNPANQSIELECSGIKEKEICIWWTAMEDQN